LLNLVSSNATLDELEQWALPILDKGIWSADEQQSLPSRFVTAHMLPPTPIHDNHRSLIGIELPCGGADNHYGLVVGRGNSPPPTWLIRKRLSEHVWYYDELPGMNSQ